MPNIRKMEKILKITPIDQAIMVEGLHGIGKSEFITNFYEKEGFRVVVKFLGQMSDAGDLLGLPFETKDKAGNTITKFAPPEWWPQDLKEKVILFLDEPNRAKPELRQAVMDLVLNRELAGNKLPENCRVVASINPLREDGYYEVEELGPALMDRFNIYNFNPDVEEWIDYMARNGGNKMVMGFINRHPDFLDPKVSIESGASRNDIQTSRRSWTRVSGLLNANPKLSIEDVKMMIWGMVGASATAAFGKYMAEEGHGLDAKTVLKKFTKEVKEKLVLMEVPDIVQLNSEIANYIEENTKEINLSDTLGATITKGLTKYLDAIPAECMAEFFNLASRSDDQGKKWAQCMFALDKSFTDKYMKIMMDEEEEKLSESD